MPNEFKIKNGLIVDSGSVQVSGSTFISGGLAIYTSASVFTTNSSTVFSIDGAAGRLFQVDDSLSGSLHSVNTIAGLPILEVFSDNTVRIGKYGVKALYVSQSAVGIGKEATLNGILDVSGSVNITGSVGILSGSFTVTTGSGIEFQVIDTGIKIGNLITDRHTVTGSLNVSGSITGSLLGTSSWSNNAVTASFITLAQTASYVITAQTSSYVQTAQTASFVTGSNVYGPYGSNSIISASYAATATNAPDYLPLTGGSITGSLIISQNLTVIGTASFIYTTASQLVVSGAYISVNAINPTSRFAGLLVYDSGSTPSITSTASLLWDSLNDKWIYQNVGSTGYSGAMLMSGPKNSGSLGNEVGLTDKKITVAQGSDHIADSDITNHTGSFVGIAVNTQVTGSLTSTGGFTGSLLGTASWANNAVTSSYITSSNVYGPYGSNSVLTSSYATTASYATRPDFHLIFAVSDESTPLTTGTSKLTFRTPYAMYLTQIPRASLASGSTSGPVTVDINDNGTSILGVNKLTIDVNEKTSTTAATPTTLADTVIPDDAEITVDIDAAGTNAAGLKVTLYYVKQ